MAGLPGGDWPAAHSAKEKPDRPSSHAGKCSFSLSDCFRSRGHRYSPISRFDDRRCGGTCRTRRLMDQGRAPPRYAVVTAFRERGVVVAIRKKQMPVATSSRIYSVFHCEEFSERLG